MSKGRYPNPELAALKGRKPKEQKRSVKRSNTPQRPKSQTPEEKAAWDEAVEALDSLGILTPADRSILELWSMSMVRYRKASQRCVEDGMTITSPNGYEQLSPWAVIVRGEQAFLQKLSQDLGLTPASRRKMGLGESSDESDALMDFVNRKRN